MVHNRSSVFFCFRSLFGRILEVLKYFVTPCLRCLSANWVWESQVSTFSDGWGSEGPWVQSYIYIYIFIYLNIYKYIKMV